METIREIREDLFHFQRIARIPVLLEMGIVLAPYNDNESVVLKLLSRTDGRLKPFRSRWAKSVERRKRRVTSFLA